MAIFFHGGSLSLLFSVTIFLSLSSFPTSSSSSSLLPHQRHLLQANSPQNIETVFPSFSIPALPSQTPPPSSSPSPLKTPAPTPAPPPPTTTSSTHAVGKAVAVTAASTLVVAGIFFFFLHRCGLARRRKHKMEKTAQVISSPRPDEEMAVSYDAFKLMNGTLKGLVVDENGLDVLYWRQLEGGGDGRRVFRKEALDRAPRREKRSAGGSRAEGLDRPRREKREGRGRALSHANSDPITRIPSNSSSAASSSNISLFEQQLPDRFRSPPHRIAATVGAEASSTPKAENALPPPPHVLAKEVWDPPPALPEKKNLSPLPPHVLVKEVWDPPPTPPEKKNLSPPPPHVHEKEVWDPPPAPPEKKNLSPPPPHVHEKEVWDPPPAPPEKNNLSPPPPHVHVKEVSDPPPALPERKNLSPPPPPPPQPLPEKKNLAPPPPPPPVKKNAAAPPPPPPPVKKNAAAPPLPPPLPVRKNPAPPPLPPRPSSLRLSSSPKGRLGSSSSGGNGSKRVAEAVASSSSSKEKEVAPQAKLKPLHWDKLTANAEHSMVWDNIGNGSFQ